MYIARVSVRVRRAVVDPYIGLQGYRSKAIGSVLFRHYTVAVALLSQLHLWPFSIDCIQHTQCRPIGLLALPCIGRYSEWRWPMRS